MAIWNKKTTPQEQTNPDPNGTGQAEPSGTRPPLVTPIDAATSHAASGAAQNAGGAGDASGAAADNSAASEETRRRAAATSLKLSATVGAIAVLMSRAPGRKHFALADIEWMILPPVLAQQVFVVEAQHKETGFRAPAAVITWAKVSSEVDKRLAENAGTQPLRLRPDEWTGGDKYWLIDAVGDGRALAPALKQLSETVFKDKPVKLVAQGEDGKVKVEVLSEVLARGATPTAAPMETTNP